MIALIAAIAENNVIGQNNGLPWHFPEDFRHFKALTVGKNILMGRKTFESLGKPLPDRTNIVITRQTDYEVPEGVYVFPTIPEALAAFQEEDIMVIGGGEIYAQTISQADRLYITHIHESYTGDTKFPLIDPAIWQETEHDDHEQFSFVTYTRM